MERGWKVRAGSQNARNILARMLHRDGNHTPKETGASRTTNGNGDHLSGLRGPRFASSMFLRFDLAPILFRTRGSSGMVAKCDHSAFTPYYRINIRPAAFGHSGKNKPFLAVHYDLG